MKTPIILAIAGFATQVHAEFSVQVGGANSSDDYICWAPIPAQVKWTGPGEGPATVLIRSITIDQDGGSLTFSQTEDDQLSEELVVTLDAAGSADFYVAGATASIGDQDVAIGIMDQAEQELHRHPMMVRVRKNAESLTDAERDRFLQAFLDAAQRNNQFAKYWGLHTDAVRLAHEEAFLPWHRTLLLQLERELQVEDSSVALPYWDFDQPAPRLYSRDFIGVVDPSPNGSPNVQFSTTNPLNRFILNDPRVWPLTRVNNGDLEVSPAINTSFMQFSAQGVMSTQIFGPYHGAAHIFIGGLIGDINRSPADPLFFLLHANVDRAWAAWQREEDRFDQTDPDAYSTQGSWTEDSNLRRGNFVKDTMWPWDGEARETDPVVLTIGTISMPPSVGPAFGLDGVPVVGETLDYLGMIEAQDAQNFCYDDIPRGVGDAADF